MPVSSKKLREKKADTGRKIKEKKEQQEKKRPVIYNELSTRIYAEGYLGPMTQDQAKTYLGWEEEGKEPFGKKFFMEYAGKKIRLKNNTNNKFFHKITAETLKQEHLRKRWKFNGEPIILGKTGEVINGQHTLISFITAVDEWKENPDRYPDWQEEPTLQKLVVLGIDEADEVVNTIDTSRGRSAADVIGRMPYFRDLRSERDRRLCSKYTEYAIKMLWHRTAVHTNAFAVRRTHSELIAYLEKHLKIIDAVRHIHEENEGDKIKDWLTPAYASACLYLMATDESDPSKYYLAADPSEDLLDFSNWDKACEFFVELAAGNSLEMLRREIRHLMSEETTVSPEERITAIAGAWQVFRLGKKVTEKHVDVQYEVDENERRIVTNTRLFGGIDVGDELPFPTNTDPTKEEIENGTKKVKAKKFPPSKKVASRNGENWAKGDRAWMHDLSLAQDNNAVFVELSEDPWTDDLGTDRVTVDDLETGDQWEAKVEELSLKQYELIH